MKKIYLIVTLFTLFAIVSCDSTYNEGVTDSDEVLVMPKADCGGSRCM